MPFGRCSAALAQLLHEKTGGNPFFATQFLQELYEAQQLRFDRAEGRWAWDETQIQAMGFTDSAVVLLVAKLERLSARALAVVKEAACMGGAALIADLSLVHGTSRAQVEVDLQPAVRAGLLHRQGSRYRFVHDRVREAAYSLIGEAQRVEVHARIGQLFLSHWSMQVIEEHVFEVADHLNRGAALVTGTAQRKALHVLNLVAGRRARASSAHTSARLYLNAAEATLDTDAWDTRYEQTFGMYLELTESELVAGDLDRAQALNRLLLAHARSNHDRARVHLLHLRFCQSAQRYRESLSTLFAALKDFSVVFPDSDDGLDAAFRAEQEAVTAQVGDRRIADLVDLAPATDADARLVIALLGESFISAFMVRPKLHRLIVARMVKLSLSFGNTEESCRAYMGYAAIVGGMQGNTQAAYEYAHLALRLNDKLPNPRARGRVLFVYAAQLVCWREPIAAAHAVLEEAHRASLEVGDVFMAAASISNIAVFSFERGDPLPTLVERARRGGEFCRHHRIATQAETNRTFEQFARCLQGKTKHTNTFDDGVYSEAQAIEILTKAESAAGKACLHVARQVNAFIGGEHRQALDYAALAATAMHGLTAHPVSVSYHLFRALTLASLYRTMSEAEQQDAMRIIDATAQQLEHWAANAPDNYRCRQALLEAERARLAGHDLQALQRYDEAIASSAANGFLQIEALGNELASRACRDFGIRSMEQAYLRSARACYARWGADGKVRQLEEQYPHLRARSKGAAAGASTARPGSICCRWPRPRKPFPARSCSTS